MQVYKKSLGFPCSKDTVLLDLYAEDNVNVETESKVTKPVSSYIVQLYSQVISCLPPALNA